MGTWQLEAISVPVGGGRSLEVVLAGPPDGLPLFSHHGTPGAAEVFGPMVERGAERNFRHIIYSRPGYGDSGRQPGRNVASCVEDIVAVAGALGYERFYSVGGSGGGPHSIACATLLRERVIAAAAVASPAPVDADGLDWTAEMGSENVTELAKARGADEEFRTYLEDQASSMLASSAEEIVAVLGDVVAEVDKRALSGELGDFLARELAHSLATGVWGWFDDDRAILGDWGFELGPDHAPLSIWHGGQDRFVPVAHGEWLARRIAADAHVRPDQGHLSLTLSSYGEILDALLDA